MEVTGEAMPEDEAGEMVPGPPGPLRIPRIEDKRSGTAGLRRTIRSNRLEPGKRRMPSYLMWTGTKSLRSLEQNSPTTS